MRVNGDLRIILPDVGKEEYVWQEEEGLFEFPLYRNCYKDGLFAVSRNIAYNRGEYQEGKKALPVNDYFLEGGIRHKAERENNNIFAFIGSRGSGKTTAINEFCRILYQYEDKYRKWEDNFTERERINTDRRFYIMPPVDASSLDAGEDLMELIWANMYHAFERKAKSRGGSRYSGDELQKTIIKEFDEVYKNYRNIGHGERREILGESVLVKLKNVSSSLKTRDIFARLTENFLKLLDEGRNSDDSYLVVVVDDLDLNLNNGYEMLEQLHKYLSDPRIIVLIAIDYRQMYKICENYFFNSMMPIHNIHDVYKKLEDQVKKLTNDYLLKVLPTENRIYLPGENLISREIIIEDGDSSKTVKEFILEKIARKMGIFYDGKGKKKHFCMPSTVRELITYNHFLDSLYEMKEIDQMAEKNGKEKGWIQLYDQNHERFNDDIANRMATQLLDEEQSALYSSIVHRNIERRAKYAVNFIQNWLGKKSNPEGQGIKQSDNVDNLFYCYGSLLNKLYLLGREDYRDKPLVHCLLASFTSEMVREYYSWKKNGDKAARRRAQDRLENFLGNTFGGEWSKDIAPQIIFPGGNSSDQKDKKEAGEGKAEEKSKENVKQTDSNVEGQKNEQGSEGSGNKKKEKENEINYGYTHEALISAVSISTVIMVNEKESSIDQVIEEILAEIPYMECFILLLSNFKDESGMKVTPEWTWKIRELEERISIEVRSNASQADYDIFGFIGKELNSSFYKDKFLNTMIQNIQNTLYDYAKATRQNFDTKMQKVLQKKITERSIWRNWKQEEISFPFYNLDLAYNVMKRAKQSILAEMSRTIKEEQIGSYLRRVYGYIAHELEEEDKYFIQQLKIEKKNMNLKKNFLSNPYIRALGICYGNAENTAESLDVPSSCGITEERFSIIIGTFLRGIDTLNIYAKQNEVD